MVILERGWRRERIRLGEKSWLKQQHGIWRAREFPLPARPLAGFAAQSTSKPLSMLQSQQTEEAYPDLSSLKRELERAQRDGEKLERDPANLEKDQAILERHQARRDLNMIRAEYQ